MKVKDFTRAIYSLRSVPYLSVVESQNVDIFKKVKSPAIVSIEYLALFTG